MDNDLRALALTNYGSFTSMRVDRGRVRGLSLHLERLAHDSRELFGTEVDLDRVRELARLRTDGVETSVVRVTVFDPELDMSQPGQDAKAEVLVTARPAAALPAPPMRVSTVRYLREASSVKHVGLFGTIYQRRQAQLAGFDDVAFVDADDNIYEGATWNVGFVTAGPLPRVVWPRGTALPGVTMRLLQQAYPHESAYLPVSELSRMAAAFATNANVGVRLIRAIDGIEFPDHPIIEELRAAYDAVPWEAL